MPWSYTGKTMHNLYLDDAQAWAIRESLKRVHQQERAAVEALLRSELYPGWAQDLADHINLRNATHEALQLFEES